MGRKGRETPMPMVEKPEITESIGRHICAMGGGISVSSAAGKAFTQRPQRRSVPSVLTALRHGEHGESWSSRPQRGRVEPRAKLAEK
jgi:hypothetical protein